MSSPCRKACWRSLSLPLAEATAPQSTATPPPGGGGALGRPDGGRPPGAMHRKGGVELGGALGRPDGGRLMYRGTLLPLRASAADPEGLRRIAVKVGSAEMVWKMAMGTATGTRIRTRS